MAKTRTKPKWLNKSFGIIALTLILFVGAVYLNVRTNSINGANKTGQPQDGGTAQASGTVATDYFEAFRTNRTTTREQELAHLNAIIAQAGTDKETLTEAQTQKLEMVSYMETEFAIETQILAKGFTDAAVTFHKGSVNVIVETAELTEEQVAQILEIVMRESGEAATNIKVSTQQSAEVTASK